MSERTKNWIMLSILVGFWGPVIYFGVKHDQEPQDINSVQAAEAKPVPVAEEKPAKEQRQTVISYDIAKLREGTIGCTSHEKLDKLMELAGDAEANRKFLAVALLDGTCRLFEKDGTYCIEDVWTWSGTAKARAKGEVTSYFFVRELFKPISNEFLGEKYETKAAEPKPSEATKVTEQTSQTQYPEGEELPPWEPEPSPVIDIPPGSDVTLLSWSLFCSLKVWNLIGKNSAELREAYFKGNPTFRLNEESSDLESKRCKKLEPDADPTVKLTGKAIRIAGLQEDVFEVAPKGSDVFVVQGQIKTDADGKVIFGRIAKSSETKPATRQKFEAIEEPVKPGTTADVVPGAYFCELDTWKLRGKNFEALSKNISKGERDVVWKMDANLVQRCRIIPLKEVTLTGKRVHIRGFNTDLYQLEIDKNVFLKIDDLWKRVDQTETN